MLQAITLAMGFGFALGDSASSDSSELLFSLALSSSSDDSLGFCVQGKMD